MPSLTSYKGLQVLTPDPTGAGGLAIQNDFKQIVDWQPKSVWSQSADPTVNDDEGDDFYPGSHWLRTNTTPPKLFVCCSSAAGAAVWQPVLLKVVQDASPALGAALDAGAFKITNLGDPTSAQDGATKAYVDASKGAWKKLGLVTASSSSAITFTNTLYGVGSYASLRFTFQNIVPVTNLVEFRFQVSTNDGSTWDTSSSYRFSALYAVNGVGVGYGTATAAYAIINNGLSNAAGRGINGTMTFNNFNQASVGHCSGTVFGERSGADSVFTSSILHTGTTARNAIKWYFDSGNISTGSILLEGMI